MPTDTRGMQSGIDTLGVLRDPEVRQTTKDEALGGPETAFEPVRVACPVCESDGTTTKRANLCGSCGAWFVVEPGEQG